MFDLNARPRRWPLALMLALTCSSAVMARFGPVSTDNTYMITSTGGDLTYFSDNGWFLLKLYPSVIVGNDARPLTPQQLIDSGVWTSASGKLLLSAQDILNERPGHAQQGVDRFNGAPSFDNKTNVLAFKIWLSEAGVRDGRSLQRLATLRGALPWVVRQMAHTVTLTISTSPIMTATANTTVDSAKGDTSLTLDPPVVRCAVLGTPEDEYAREQEVADTLEDVGVTIAQLAISEIPVVGSFLSAIVGFLFQPSTPTQSPIEIWDSIKAYAEVAIKAAVDEATLSNVDKQLQGISGAMLDYKDLTQPSPQKTQAFTSITEILTQLTPQFISGPVGLLAYLTPFGTIRIGFMRELVTNYTDIYGGPDPNAAANLKHLKATISTLTTATNTAMASQLQARQSHITLRTVNPTTTGGCGLFYHDADCGYIVAQDTVTGYSSQTYFDEHGSMSKSTAMYIGTNWYNSMLSTATALMTAHMDALTAPAREWPLMDPTFGAHVINTTKAFTTGLFGGRSGTQFSDQPAKAGARLTAISMHSGDGIDGLQFSWDGVPDRLIGGTSGSQSQTLQLQPGEYITRIQIGNGDAINYIIFTTNMKRTLTGGRPTSVIDIDFSSPMLSVSLCGVGGKTGTSNVQGISFKWCYQYTTLDKAYPVTQM